MRIYWYWPHPHANASPLALATLRSGDSLTVQALSSLRGQTFGAISEYTVVRDLPDPTRPTSPLGRLARPARIAAERSVARRHILRREFDIAHLQLLNFQYDWLDLRSLRRRPPIVSMVHDVVPHQPYFGERIDRVLLRRLYSERCSGHLLVFHRVLKEQLMGEFDVEPERVHVIPHPLDASTRRLQLQPLNERPYVLFFGTLRANKGVDILLDATLRLGQGSDFDVLIAGAGSDDVVARIRHVAERISWLRFEPGYASAARKAELFSRAGMVLLPYTAFASQSGVLADCFVYRVPAMVSDVGALGETVRDHGVGWVLECLEPDAVAASMTAAMSQLSAGQSFSAQLDAAAHAHDYSVVGPLLRQVYETVSAMSATNAVTR